MNRPVSIGLLPVYSIDPSQHNNTSVRSSVRTTEGLESHGSGSSQTPECIPGRPERLPVPRGVEDKCEKNVNLGRVDKNRLSSLFLYRVKAYFKKQT